MSPANELRPSPMPSELKAELAERALEGYPHGPDATVAATLDALEQLDGADVVLLVEGVTDLIATETLAERMGAHLDELGILVLPIGGAQQVGHYVRALGPNGHGFPLVGLCDADAVGLFGRELPEESFFVCDPDIEHELIRSVGTEAVEAVFNSQGELRSFRTFQKQPEWRDQPAADQLRRFIGSKARRGQRYARLLIETVDPIDAPQPLRQALSAAQLLAV